MSFPYYEENAKAFFERTAYLDISQLYDFFVKHLPENAHILDAGCGSGRDSKAFLERGYQVTAFDGSAELAKLASDFTGLDIKAMQFGEMDYDEAAFDAIWANATLLHIPREELSALFPLFIRALKPEGVWFMSFKEGEGERKDDFERHFTNFSETLFQEFIKQFPSLEIVEILMTDDSRPDHQGERWLNAILRKR